MSSLWAIPRLWPESTVFILGGGPSLLKVNLDLIKSQRVIGVNHAVELGSWVDVLWYGDKNWGLTNQPLLRNFGGLKVTCSVEANEKRKIPDVRYVGRSKSFGLELKKNTHIGWNGNSGASAINLAYWLGAKRVVLIGFDMKMNTENGIQTHWHDRYTLKYDHHKKIVNPYPRFMRGWPIIAVDAERAGLEIVNSSPDSELTIFPYKPLELICQTISPLMLL